MRARKLIAQLEKDLSRRFARPAWLRAAQIRLDIRESKFDLAIAERFAGIRIGDAATEINAPNVERFNDILRILAEENKDADALRFGESYFARMLALGQFDAANFAGLARVFFQQGDAEKGIKILRLMVDAGDETKRETTLAETAAIDAVRTRVANAVKTSVAESNSISQADALKIAAEIAFENQLTNEAIAFRRALLGANPADSTNKLELAAMLSDNGEKQQSATLLVELINDQNAPRTARWQARLQMNAELPNASFDAFSQFYNGTIIEKSNQPATAAEFFINSLIADKDAEVIARQHLIKSYIAANKFFAALRLAETDKSAKPDELLDALSATAEKVLDFGRAIEFEKSKSVPNVERILDLEKLVAAKNQRVTDFKVDLESTRKL